MYVIDLLDCTEAINSRISSYAQLNNILIIGTRNWWIVCIELQVAFEETYDYLLMTYK